MTIMMGGAGATIGISFTTEPPGTVTLTGADPSGLYTEVVGIRVNSDGTIDQKIDAVYTQLSSTTDWIIPNGDASSLHDVRVTNVVDQGGDPIGFNTAAAADDTWISLSANREWTVKASGPGGADSNSMAFDLEIRYNGGIALASTGYTISSEFS